MPVKKSVKAPMKNKSTAPAAPSQPDKKISNPGELFNLIKYLETEKVDEFEYSDQDFSVSLKRTVKSDSSDGSAAGNAALLNMLASRHAVSSVSAAGGDAPADDTEKSSGKSPAPAAEDESKFKFIESPITGTFYRAPSPTSTPYVENGTLVQAKQRLFYLLHE